MDKGKAPSLPVREVKPLTASTRVAHAPRPTAALTPHVLQGASNQAVQRLMKADGDQNRIQLSRPGGTEEQEAEQVAEQMTKGGGIRASGKNKLRSLALQGKRPLSASSSLNKALSSGGRSLDPVTRVPLESQFGHDFSQVRVHTSAEAGASARMMNSQAYTIGQDIVFATGRYAPETTIGRKLLAHELAHTIQGSRNSQTIIRRNPENVQIAPQHKNQKVATWEGLFDTPVETSFVVGEVPIASYITPFEAIPVTLTPAGWTPGHYPSEAAAISAIQAAGTAGAVFVESGRFVAYHVQVLTLIYDFSYDNIRWSKEKPWTRLRFDSAASAIVTADGVAIRPDQYKTEEEAESSGADQALMPGAEANPFKGYKEVFGDFNQLGDTELIRLFYAAMKDNALSVLSKGRKQVEREIERRFSCGIITQDEIKVMRSTAEYLAALDTEIEAIPKEFPYSAEEYGEFVQRKQRFDAFQARRKVVLARYPVLARVNPRSFIRLSESEQNALLGAEAVKVLADIDKTRDDVIDGSVNLWKIQRVVESTIVGLGIRDEERRKKILKYAESGGESVLGPVLTIFSIAFGLASIVATGPLAVALAAGAFGLGVADAIQQTEDWFAEASAANTAMDPAESLLSPEETSSWGWLVVAWVGVVFDAADVLKAVKAVHAAGGAIEEGVKVLAKGDVKAAKELRLAAGIIEAGQEISEATRVAVARRLGTTLEIEEGLGKEIRVHYSVDSRGRVTIDGIRCGPNALTADILAHASVVRLLRRYDGLLGRMRQLWDRLISLATGANPANVNPFPPGSQAFESWLELKKLPEIVERRRSALGEVLGTESEAALRRDVDFLESELAHHQSVVDNLTIEKGVGYVASAEEQTAKAIHEGMPPLAGNSLIEDPSKYYYRINPSGQPPYTLTRFSEAGVPPRTLVPDGKGGWMIAEGALSRAELARRTISQWPQGVQDAFHAFEGAYEAAGVFKIVPLQGVATTGKRVGELSPTIQEDLYEILMEAFRRANDPDPLGKATSAVNDVLSHEIVAVKGTDQLRAFNYRLNFASATGETASGDLHHLIPLYLGGGHTKLVDVHPDLHNRLHDLIDQIRLDPGTTLAPHSIQVSEALNFSAGAAVLFDDGTVQLTKLNLDGTFTLVP